MEAEGVGEVGAPLLIHSYTLAVNEFLLQIF
jgi:hypothetical protein